MDNKSPIPPTPFGVPASINTYMACQICNKHGHTAGTCHEQQNLSFNAEFTSLTMPSQVLFDPSPQNQCLDSDGTYHMMPSTTSLSHAQPDTGNDSITVVNGSQIPITHVGQVLFLHPPSLLL